MSKASTATELSTALAKASVDSIRAQHNRISDLGRKAWDATSRTKLDSMHDPNRVRFLQIK
jgi:hypothetical protein